MALRIKNIFAYEVLDSRGFPTVAAIAQVSGGMLIKRTVFAKAIVPSGASTGDREALELRDKDPKRYHGKGVKQAVKNINDEIAPALIESKFDPVNQEAVDQFLIDLDGTPNKSKFGANAILAVSLAVAKAVAKYYNLPFYRYITELYQGHETYWESKFYLPLPMVNVINGGEHADNTIDFQEFMFMPVGARSMHEAVRMSSECFHALQKLLHEKGYNTNKGDEGGFAPNLKSAEEALTLMTQAVVNAGFKPGIDQGSVAFALDCAASELYDRKRKVYVFKKALAAGWMSQKQATKNSDQMIAYLKTLVDKFPIVSIEDGLDQSDWEGFAKLVTVLGHRIQIVGDDLFCTNPEITADGVQKQVANSVLVKLNQIGTLSETLKTIRVAEKAGWTWVISHRSGETEDTTIADLAVGTASSQIKTGSMSRSERIAKYNRLLEIEMEVGRAHAVFLGLQSFRNLTLPFEKEPERVLIGPEEVEEKVDVASLSLVHKNKRKKTASKKAKVAKKTLGSQEPVEVESLDTDQLTNQDLLFGPENHLVGDQTDSSVTDAELSALTDLLVSKPKRGKKGKKTPAKAATKVKKPTSTKKPAVKKTSSKTTTNKPVKKPKAATKVKKPAVKEKKA